MTRLTLDLRPNKKQPRHPGCYVHNLFSIFEPIVVAVLLPHQEVYDVRNA